MDKLEAKVLDTTRDIEAETLEVPQQLNKAELSDFFFNPRC